MPPQRTRARRGAVSASVMTEEQATSYVKKVDTRAHTLSHTHTHTHTHIHTTHTHLCMCISMAWKCSNLIGAV